MKQSLPILSRSAIILTLTCMLLIFAACKDNSTNPNDQSVSACEFSPAGGVYDSSVDVLISCPTPGVTIRYTTDGSEPAARPLHTPNLFIGCVHHPQSQGLQAGWISSGTSSADYVLTSIAPPQIDPPGGSYTPRKQ
jgi:hypothetical protein